MKSRNQHRINKAKLDGKSLKGKITEEVRTRLQSNKNEMLPRGLTLISCSDNSKMILSSKSLSSLQTLIHLNEH